MSPVAAPAPNPAAHAAPHSAAEVAHLALRHIDAFRDVEITEMDIRRTENMFALCQVPPTRVLETLRYLEMPAGSVPWTDRPRSSERRIVLAVMLSVAVGFNHTASLGLIDQARALRSCEILEFVAGATLAAATASAGLYGAYLACSKAVAGVGAKAATLKAGGMTTAGTLGAGLGACGWSLLGVGSFLLGGKMVATTLDLPDQARARHPDIMDGKDAKDHKLWEGIKRAHIEIGAPRP